MTLWMRDFLLYSLAMAVIAGLYALASARLRKRYAAKWLYLAGIVLLIGFWVPFRPALTIPAESAPAFLQNEAGTANPAPAQVATQAARTGPPAAQAPPQVSPWHIVFLVWIAGACGTLLYHGAQHARFLRSVGRWSEPVRDAEWLSQLDAAKRDLRLDGREIALRHCACVSSPMLIWLGRPVILLPEHGTTADDLPFILLHELIHHKRKDLLGKALALLAMALHWFNPAVYLLARLVALQCEISCDEKVMENRSADDRRQYAMSIIGVARAQARDRTLLTTSFYGGKKAMKIRIMTIVQPNKRKIGALLLACAVLLTLAAGTSVAVEKVDEGYTYLAITNGLEEGTTRVVRADVLGMPPIRLLLLPEESGEAEDYASVGIRATFAEPIDMMPAATDAEYMRMITEPLQPTRVEIAGQTTYGRIVELGEAYVILDAYDETYALTGSNDRYTVTPDTYMQYEAPFEAGSGCMMIVDKDGTVLAMVEQNG